MHIRSMQSSHLTWFILTVDFGLFFFLSALALSCMEAGRTWGKMAVNDLIMKIAIQSMIYSLAENKHYSYIISRTHFMINSSCFHKLTYSAYRMITNFLGTKILRLNISWPKDP